MQKNRDNFKRITVSLNKNKDKELINFIESKGNASAYIRKVLEEAKEREENQDENLEDKIKQIVMQILQEEDFIIKNKNDDKVDNTVKKAVDFFKF